MRKLVVTLVVLLLLAVGVDRAADYVAERVVAGELRSSQHLRTDPDVSIDGFPFLTQFAAGRYDHVTAAAHRVRVGDTHTGVTLSSVRLDFRGVTASKDFTRFRARTATARARVSYAALSHRVGARVRYGGTGRVRATKSFDILGARVSPTVSVRPSVSGDTLSFTGSRIEGLPSAPAPVAQALAGIFDTSVSLSGIPFAVKVRSLRVTRAGLVLVLTGRDLTYSR